MPGIATGVLPKGLVLMTGTCSCYPRIDCLFATPLFLCDSQFHFASQLDLLTLEILIGCEETKQCVFVDVRNVQNLILMERIRTIYVFASTGGEIDPS
jgi:hypothetical protein